MGRSRSRGCGGRGEEGLVWLWLWKRRRAGLGISECASPLMDHLVTLDPRLTSLMDESRRSIEHMFFKGKIIFFFTFNYQLAN